MDFSNLFQHVPDNLVVITPDFTIVAATDAYLQTTMRTREEIIGLHFLLEAFPDKNYSFDENPVRKSIDRVFQTKQVDHMDLVRYTLTRPAAEGGGDYESIWEASHTPLLDQEGNIEYIIQKTSDVTEREKAKLAHRESENKFRIMTDTVPQLIYTVSPEGQVTFVNERFVKYTGVSAQDTMASPTGFLDAIHPEDKEIFLTRAQESFQKQVEFQAELRLRDREGNYRWFVKKCSPVTLPSGQVSLWVGSATDIHATKQMVQELLESNEQMAFLSDQVHAALQKAESERKTLENMILTAPAIFCTLTGPEHRYDLINPYYQALFPERELKGKTVKDAVPEAAEQGFVDLLDNVYRTGTPFSADEILFHRKHQDTGEQEDLYLTLNYQPIFGENMTIIGILVFGYEITEHVKLRERLQKDDRG
ncbi:PAS domain-containing protein [Rufibacter latericius]|uniref:histidine kinase n=1 Tax=Rufibacter latericius TaxID=2487040 RepID=A0A3M9MEN2_9BACT|nr:PAS domain-containing protein [Rufibacter latericius]RNI23587.1 PAS domain S-box protein [Rufibacter latericius]